MLQVNKGRVFKIQLKLSLLLIGDLQFLVVIHTWS